VRSAESAGNPLRLHAWQSVLQAAILDPRRERMQLKTWLQTGAIDVDSQLDIYANAYVLRLIEALRSNYPAVHLALGDRDFEIMAQRYLEQYPSERASIRWFGDALASFLQARQPYAGVPLLGELAVFEWAIRHSIDAADAARVTVDSLLSLPAAAWCELRFGLHPSATRLSLRWNAPQVWRALTDAAEASGEYRIEPEPQAMDWVVWRKPDLASGWRSLSAGEAAALDALVTGATFADLCEQVAGRHVGDAASQAASLLRAWVEQGLLIARDAQTPSTD